MSSIERILKRVDEIEVSFTLDTGEKIVKKMSKDDLNKIPGLTAGIHSTGTVLGYVTGKSVEDWYKENPKTETKLQKAIKEGQVRTKFLDRYPNIKRENGKSFLELWDEDFNRVNFYYDNDTDLREDFEYCKTFLVND